MSPSRPFLTALLPSIALALAVVPACTPSSSGAHAPATANPPDSAAEAHAGPSASVETAPEATRPEPVANDTPTCPPITDPPSPDVAVRPFVAAHPVPVPSATSPYRVRLVDENARDLPTFYKNGRPYVLGNAGSRYSIVVSNPTGRRVEAVVAVDGLDAIDGQTGDYATKRGYIVPPYGSVNVDGFRTSFSQVATFRFSSVGESYAGRLGKARDVGVVGVAFFPERVVEYAPSDAVSVYGGGGAAPAPATRSATNELDGPPPPPAATAPVHRSATKQRAAMAPHKPGSSESGDDRARAGIGTEFGEARENRVVSTQFERQNGTIPSQIVAFRYNDRQGLLALGIPLPPQYASAEVRTRETANPFPANGFAQPPP